MFQKLKLETRSKPPPSSHFAAIRRQSPSHTPPLNESNQSAPVAATDSDDAHSKGDTVRPDQAHENHLQQPVGQEGTRHGRSPSISFNPQVITDSGHHLSIDQPIPKPKALRDAEIESLGGDSESPLYEDDIETPPSDALLIANAPRAHSESHTNLFDPVTGRPLDGPGYRRRLAYRNERSRHPLLQTTVGDLAQEGNAHDRIRQDRERQAQKERELEEYEANERVASLTSETTASPTFEEAATPLDESQYMLSPLPTSSPIEFPFPPQGRPYSNSISVSQRTRSVRSNRSAAGSLRRTSRRSSARSQVGTPSISPASAFLSNWSKEDKETISQPEPDDEGQEIGDHSEYIIGRQIGFGAFSAVKEVFTLGPSGDKVKRAVKIVRKHVMGKCEADNERVQQDFEREVSVWRFLKHSHVLPLLAVYDSPFATFCITRLNVGGTLFDLVRQARKAKPPGPRSLAPRLARRYIAQLASALRYLHNDVHVVHRDVKLENCLVDMTCINSDTEGGNLLLCDFGMADFITNEHRASPEPYESYLPTHQGDADGEGRTGIGPGITSSSVVAEVGTGLSGGYGGAAGGSLPYAAPELLDAPHAQPLYSTAVDMWAFGVVAHTLLAGDLPFAHTFEPRLAMAITKGQWDVEALHNAVAMWGPESERMELGWQGAAVEMVEGCMAMESVARWTIADVVQSTYLAGCSELVEESMEASWLEG